MSFHEEARQLANDALDGMNVSKQTLANKLLIASNMIRRLEEACKEENKKSSTSSESKFNNSSNAFQDIFGGVFK